MPDIYAHPASEAQSRPESGRRSRDRIRDARRFLFPEWSITVAAGLVFTAVFSSLCITTSGAAVSGGLAGLMFGVAMTMACLMWDTYSPAHRTLWWGTVLSILCGWGMAQFGLANLLFLMVPNALLMAARANMNLRRLLATLRNR